MAEPETDQVPQANPRTSLAGWAFAAAFAAHATLGVFLPRLEKESAVREMARGWHYLLGLAAFGFAIWLIARWRRDGFIIPPGRVPAGLRTWHSALAILLVTAPIVAAPLGFLNAWGEGRTVHLASMVTLPTMMEQDRAVWQFAGYVHSALGLSVALAALAGLLSAGYSYVRYRKGLFAAFPAPIGFLVLHKAVVFVYAINSFRDRLPGVIAGAVLLGVVGAVWLAGASRKPAEAGSTRPMRAGMFALLAASLGSLAIVAAAMFGPYLMFRVTPFAQGVKIAAAPDDTWHRDRVAGFVPTPETEFERTVGMETYKWCEFCHTVTPGAKPLVGPNLHNIFGQRAAQVPNFFYSEAMAKAGRKGLIWNEQTIAQYIADPDRFVPGTTMHISSGPVSDPRVRAAVVAILKRRTMGEEGPQ